MRRLYGKKSISSSSSVVIMDTSVPNGSGSGQWKSQSKSESESSGAYHLKTSNRKIDRATVQDEIIGRHSA